MITKKLKRLLKNKSIYLSPYTLDVIELHKAINLTIPSCKVVGYIDSFKEGENIYKLDEIDDTIVDNILVYSFYSLEIITKKYVEINPNIKNKLVQIGIDANYKYRIKNYSKKKKNIVCFGNCQAVHIAYFLEIFAHKLYNVVFYHNYVQPLDDEKIISEIKKADVLIYQPLSDEFNNVSYSNIKKLVKKFDVKLITFPYIYNNGMYSLESDIEKNFFGEEIILKLYKSGKNKEEILRLYSEGKIDFKLKDRFENSLSIMKKKENGLSIQLTKYIVKNYRKKKLFHCCNHPSNDIFYVILKKIKNILQVDFKIKKNSNFNHLYASLVPISPYDVETRKYEFSPDYMHEWYYKGSAIINLIILKYELGVCKNG
jgi:hypothetical protein